MFRKLYAKVRYMILAPRAYKKTIKLNKNGKEIVLPDFEAIANIYPKNSEVRAVLELFLNDDEALKNILDAYMYVHYGEDNDVAKRMKFLDELAKKMVEF